MDITNVIIAIFVVLLVLSFRWFLRKFCDAFNWNSQFTSHPSSSNSVNDPNSREVLPIYTIQVNVLLFCFENNFSSIPINILNDLTTLRLS